MNHSRAKFRSDWTKVKGPKLFTRPAFRILVSGFVLSILLAVMTIFMVWASYQNATLEWRERISGLAGMIGAHAKLAVTSSDDVLLALVSRLNSLNRTHPARAAGVTVALRSVRLTVLAFAVQAA